MPILPDPPPPFCCAICGEDQMTNPWAIVRRASNPIKPICIWCERTWGRGLNGPNDLNPDRRLIRQVSALAAVLSATAHCKQNGHRGPYERA